MRTKIFILLTLFSLNSLGAILNSPLSICTLKDEFSKVDVLIYKTAQPQQFELEVRDYVDRDSTQFRKYVSKNLKVNLDNKRKTIEVLQGHLQNGQPIHLARRIEQRSLTNTEPAAQFAALSVPSLFSKNIPLVCTSTNH